MSRPTLVLAGDDLGSDAEDRWLRPVLASWPRHARLPTPERVGLGTLQHRLDALSPDQRTNDVYLIVGEPRRNASDLARLIDRLLAAAVPAVLVARKPKETLRHLEARGLMVVDPDVHESHLAWVLHTLLTRQPALHTLAEELRVASLSGDGLAGEMTRLQEEMHLAAAIQRELLPGGVPEMTGVDLGVLFRPAGYLSGDLYDLRASGPETVSFCLADAMGHGLPAAMLTLLIAQHLARSPFAGVSEAEPSPGAILAGLNRAMTDRAGETARFATGVLGHVNTRTGRVVLASAGHPPALLCRAGVPGMMKDVGGPLLGVMPEASYEDTEATLNPGDALLVYTDGFEMAFPSRDGAGLDKPTEAYREHLPRILGEAARRGEPMREAALKLGEMLDEQAGSLHQPDDVTVLAIARCAEAAAKAA